MSQVSTTPTAPPPVPLVFECPRCREWLVGRDDVYCGLCGNLLLHLSISPERDILIAGLASPTAREKVFTLKNGDKAPVKIKISMTDHGLPGLVVDPLELTVPAHGEAKFIARLDEAKLPPQLQEKTVRLRCLIGGDPRKARDFEIMVRTGPKPVLAPRILHFGQLQESTAEDRTQIPVGSAAEATRSLAIRNAGGIPLMAEKITIEGSSQLRFVAPGLPARIDPGRTFQLKVVWDTTVAEESPDTSKAGLRIHYRNAESGFVQAEAKLVRFAVGIEPQKISISPAFSKHDYLERIELRNRGTVDVEIVGFEADQPWLEIVSRHKTFALLSPNPAEKRTVIPNPAGERFDFDVVCHPQQLEEGKHQGQIVVRIASGQHLPLHVDVNVIRPVAYHEYIGIDFGTTNSVVAIHNEVERRVELVEDFDRQGKGSPLIPSILTLRDHKTYLIGHQARNEAMTSPDMTVRSIKRIMGYDNSREFFGRKFNPEQLASFIIKKLVELAEARLYELSGKYYDIKRAIVTVPANFYDVQVRGVLMACALAGIDTEEETAQKTAERLKEALGTTVNAGIVLDEPSAAALYFISHLMEIGGTSDLSRMIARKLGLNLLVFDYGGGTLDVSVTNVSRLEGGGRGLRILANMGDNKLGGDSIDILVMHELLADCRARYPRFDDSLIRDRFHQLENRRSQEGWDDPTWASVLAARMRWKDTAEEVKIRLSRDIETTIEVPPEAVVHLQGGRIHYSSESFEASFTRERFDALIEPTLDKCGALVRSALDLAGLPLKSIDYVLHSGRQSLTKAIRERVRSIFPGLAENRDILDERHLKVCVAQGAAYYGLLRNLPTEQNAEVRIINDGRRLPHGYGIEKADFLQRFYKEIIPRGTEYPTTACVKLDRSPIRSGEPLRLKFYQNTGLSNRIIDNPEIRPIGQIEVPGLNEEAHALDIQFRIDSNRRLEVLVGEKILDVKSLRQTDEEDWLG